MLWIGIFLLPLDGFKKAPTTVSLQFVNQLDTAQTVYVERGYKCNESLWV